MRVQPPPNTPNRLYIRPLGPPGGKARPPVGKVSLLGALVNSALLVDCDVALFLGLDGIICSPCVSRLMI